MSDTILISGFIDIDPAKRDAAIEAARTMMDVTRAEEGCDHYAFSADLTDPGRFYVAEQWASQAVLDSHMASAHMAEFLTAMGGFGVTASSITKWVGATPSKLM